MDEQQTGIARLKAQWAILKQTERALAAAGMGEAGLMPVLAQLAELEAQIRAAGGTLDVDADTGGGDVITRDQNIYGDKVAGDKIAGHKILATLADGARLIGGDVHGLTVITAAGVQVTMAPDDVPVETLLAAYNRSLASEACRLPLGTIDVEFVRTSGEHSPPLPDVYVDLDVVAPPEKEEDGGRSWGLRMARGEGEGRTVLLEALSRPDSRLAVLLGDAGSGKSTFVNYVTYQIAAGRPGLPEAWAGPVVRLVLREVAARHIPANAEEGTAEMLWKALEEDMAACLGAAGAAQLLKHVQATLWTKGGLVLLDGLDEVPEAQGRRKALLQAVAAVAESLPAESGRVLVTARPYAYADKAWRLDGFQTLALAPFSEAQVARFVDRWYQAVRQAMNWNEETARGKGEALQEALDERPYLADLASRPLLLTLMATLHSSWGTLPEDRAGLYEETVKLLLGRWQRAREVRGPDGALVMEPGIGEALGVGEDRIRSALQDLAFTVHARQRLDDDGEDEPADIGEGEVLVAFKPLLGTVDPDALLRYLQERAGLLIERRSRVYAFPHRSFQEYLAACYLADQGDFGERLAALVWEDPLWWREVALLGAGKAKQGGLGNAVALMATILPDEVDDVARPTDTHWRVAALAGMAAQELRLVEKAAGQRHYEALLRKVRRWLARLVETGQLTPAERLEAGDTLGRLGDPRPGVGVTVVQVGDGEIAVPDILWVEIPAGEFLMGTPEGDEMAWEDEHPQHQLILPAYLIARYPVTNAQFRPFVEGDGYDNADYWTPQGWAWRQGAEADLSPIDNEDLRKQYADWLAERPAERRNRPWWWEDRRLGAANRPVVGVSWYEALAYCRWLETRLWAAGDRSHGQQPGTGAIQVMGQEPRPMPAGAEVRLPSEAEWEQAARGRDGRRWPWGNAWQADGANGEETGLQQTSPVGMFPGGTSPERVLDMAGNVWQWTRSRWGRSSELTPDYLYPYDLEDGREDLDGPDWRILRGGSWYNEQTVYRCAARNWYLPDNFTNSLGFRVVMSLADSES